MTGIPLAYGGAKRATGRFAEVVQRNMFAEAVPGDPRKGFALLGRPGLEDFATQPTGGRRAAYQRTDLFNSDALIIAGTTIARLSSSGVLTSFAGSVGGTGLARIAAGRNGDGDDIARIATGTGLFLAQGTTVTEEDFPDVGGAGAQDVESHRDFWFALEAGTDKFYFKIPGDAQPWAALEYATNEYRPDRGVAVRELGDQIWFLNAASTEAWGLTGAADIVAPLGGLIFNFGCLARDTAISLGDELAWVDNNYEVRITSGGFPSVVSDNGLTEEIRRSDVTSLRAWYFQLDGHRFYILSLGIRGTWAFDLSTRLWHPWASKGYPYLRWDQGCQLGGRTICLDALSTAIWRLNDDRNFDVADEIDCTFTAIAPMEEGALSCDNFSIDCAVGFAPQSGAGSDPMVSMRYSDDESRTWTPWRNKSLGQRGHYETTVRWNGLGEIKAPKGRHFQVRSTDGTVRRFANPRINIR